MDRSFYKIHISISDVITPQLAAQVHGSHLANIILFLSYKQIFLKSYEELL